MKEKETDFIFILLTAILAIIGLSYLFEHTESEKIQPLSDDDGFDQDAKNLHSDMNNISKDFNTAKEEFFKDAV